MPVKTESWDLNTAVSFIHNHKKVDEVRKAEMFFQNKLKETKSEEQKSEYYYYLLRCRLMKHTVFETNSNLKLYNDMIKCFKRVEKSTIQDYKKNKNEISKSATNAFYVTVEHYLGSLSKIYKEKNFVDATTRSYIDEMNFRKDKYKLSGHYLRYVAFSFFNITSKYGNSMGRWILTTLIVMLFFAFNFFLVDMFSHIKMIDFSTGGHFFDYIYYSIITFTTLGYGDISPVNVIGELLAITEVSTGYLMLGMLVNLLGKKL